MMWPALYAKRLASWNELRITAAGCDLDQALLLINQWWFQTAWTPYLLHWDDCESWPDPWQLLDNRVFCSLARGLGILYTITLLERADLKQSWLVEHDSDNLVLIPGEKYILNWDRSCIVNITPGLNRSKHQISQQQLSNKIL